MSRQETRLPVTVGITATEEDGDNLSLTTRGVMTDKGDGALLLVYREQISEDDETEETEVRMHIRPGRVMVLQSAGSVTTMMFARGQRYEGPYRTSFGDLSMSIFTTGLSLTGDASGGRVEMRYQIEIGDSGPVQRIMRVEWKASA